MDVGQALPRGGTLAICTTLSQSPKGHSSIWRHPTIRIALSRVCSSRTSLSRRGFGASADEKPYPCFSYGQPPSRSHRRLRDWGDTTGGRTRATNEPCAIWSLRATCIAGLSISLRCFDRNGQKPPHDDLFTSTTVGLVDCRQGSTNVAQQPLYTEPQNALPGSTVETFFTNVKGNDRSWLDFVLPEKLLFVGVPNQAEFLLAHFDRYLFREEVVLERQDANWNWMATDQCLRSRPWAT